MPEISRFYGIIIKMYFGDHAPPHFHAEYGDDEALIAIRSVDMISGSLPPRAWALVKEWATMYQAELVNLWDLAAQQQPIPKLPPLK